MAVKALTLTQPWATLVALGEKIIETRSWGTSYRGTLAIHAAKGFPREAQEFAKSPVCQRVLNGYFGSDAFEVLVNACGHVISTVRLTDVRGILGYTDSGPVLEMSLDLDQIRTGQTHFSSQHTWEQERSFGDFSPGRYAWLLSEPQTLQWSPARGSLGLWDWNG